VAVAWTAERMLARAWHRAGRRSWHATSAVLAAVLVAVLLVAGLFAGMEQETDRRVADFYTRDLRVTPEKPGAAPQAAWQGSAVAAVLEAARSGGGHASPRMESQFILSRRSLVEAYLEEQGQYTVGGVGGETRTGFYGVGVLVGADTSDAAAMGSLRRHLVVGRLPAPADRVELLMSTQQFRNYLSAPELGNLTGYPPTADELASFRFEVTAARVSQTSVFKDVIRRPAQVVGLYDTGLDALDGFTLATDIGSVRVLLGHAANATVANAVTVSGGDLERAQAEAQRRGWAVEGPEGFAQRYLGQLLAVLQALALVMAALFFALPLFLLWHGLQQILERQRREVAVCRAIGVGRRRIRHAFGLLVARVVLTGLVAAGIVVAALRLGLPSWLEGSGLIPLPVTFLVPAPAVGAMLAVTIVSALLALGFALRSEARSDLAAILRAA
jgi:ABC-type lipoprotein release transport system permease subunit